MASLYVCLITVTSIISTTESCHLKSNASLYFNKASSNGALISYEPTGIKMCVKYCAQRSNCQAVEFENSYLACGLKSVNSSEAKINRQGTVFTDLTSWKMTTGCSSLVCHGDSRCITIHGKSRPSLRRCISEVSQLEGQGEKTSAEKRKESLLFEEDSGTAYHVDSTGNNLSKLPCNMVDGCNLWSAAYDMGRVYWMCDTGRRMGIGNYTGTAVIFERVIKLPGVLNQITEPKKSKYYWFDVDKSHKVIIASEEYSGNIVRFVTDGARPDIDEVVIIYRQTYDLKSLQIDKNTRYVYWIKDTLRRIDYNGLRALEYTNINVEYFFLELYSAAEPRLHGCKSYRISQYILHEEAATLVDPEIPNGLMCAGIWRLGNITYIYRSNKAGLWYSDDRGMYQNKWTGKVNPESIFVVTVD